MTQILVALLLSASAVLSTPAQAVRSARITVDFGRSLGPMEIDKMALGQGGPFNFQNTMRPAYFSFKLLSRLTGNRVPAQSTNDKVDALVTDDPIFQMRHLMFWNFSATPVKVKLGLQNVPAQSKAVPFVLDPLIPSNDENHRIRMSEEFDLTSGVCTHELELEPWAVHLWYVHGKSWNIGN